MVMIMHQQLMVEMVQTQLPLITVLTWMKQQRQILVILKFLTFVAVLAIMI